jgi:hypothetical protein
VRIETDPRVEPIGAINWHGRVAQPQTQGDCTESAEHLERTGEAMMKKYPNPGQPEEMSNVGAVRRNRLVPSVTALSLSVEL